MIQVNTKFEESMVAAIDRLIDPVIGETRSMFIRKSVKDRIKSLEIEVKKNE